MRPKVFISYSHKDARWKDRLVRQLGVLQQEDLLHFWHDGLITAGADWLPAIEAAMATAQVAVLLVSADFLNSEFIRRQEVPVLIERRQKEGLLVVPVIVDQCPWQRVRWLSPIQARPSNGKTLADLKRVQADGLLSRLAEEILELVQGSAPAGNTTSSERPLRLPVVALPRLHQLPAPPADFTGRDDELSDLRASIAAGGATAIFGLRGIGGVGKTALALKLAEEVADRYPDGQIYVDLKGVTTPLRPAQAMAWVVRSFLPEVPVPEDEAELAAAYRSVLHGKRVLLLMDNAANRDQVEPLRPPAGCALLVTSRFHFSFSGLTTRDLDELPPDKAQKLLLRSCPRIGAAAVELARVCGGLPLALSLAAGALNDRSDISPAAYAEQLAAGRKRLDGVDAALDLSLRLLPEDLQQLWRLLAVFPGTFDRAAAAAVWELEEDVADEALGKLVTSSMLEWEDRVGRYRLHDLARSFAERQLAPEEREMACRRHAVYYVEVLRRGDEQHQQGGEGIARGLSLFDSEWENIKAAQAWASAQPPADLTATELTSEYANVGVHCLVLRLHSRDQLRWLQSALAAARRTGNRGSEASHLGNMGLAFGRLGEPRRAIECQEAALAICREIGDRLKERNALGNMGNVYAALGEPRRAIELGEQALGISREIGDRFGEGIALGNLGVRYFSLGEAQRAIEFYEQQLAISREIGDRLGEGRASWNLGLVFEHQGDLARAAELMQVMVDLERELVHPDADMDADYVAAIRAKIAGGGSGHLEI